MGENDRVNERQAGTRNTHTHTFRERASERGEEFVWLVGFLTFSSTTSLYRGQAPRQSV